MTSSLFVQLFHGKFWSCNDTSVPDKDACVGTFMEDGEVRNKHPPGSSGVNPIYGTQPSAHIYVLQLAVHV